MTSLERIERKLDAIIHHLGIDGKKIVSMKSVREQAQKDVLRWKEKQLKKEHVGETPERRPLAD